MSVKKSYMPPDDVIAAFPEISGNSVNGFGQSEYRQAAPFFWHPPELQPHGGLQAKVLEYLFSQEEVALEFSHVAMGGPVRGPEPVAQSDQRVQRTPQEWSADIKQYGLANEADVVGIAAMRDDYLFEGFQNEHKYIVIVGVAHDYDTMKTAPAYPGNTGSAVEVGRQYNRGARAVSKLRNYILEQGYPATTYPGPMADAINMVPAAIDCGLGELGKHGSLIHRELGSSFRLAALTTDLPLVTDSPDVFGVDAVCSRCQACERACPPRAIYSEKQMVRGTAKWYVDFDKCIPFFAEAYGCAACIAACPWSIPGVADNLLNKLARRKAREGED
ncbi:MAG: 4Fe-4S dicluster domain-containing protein [Haliea sp.]|jgi:ferredoxin|nr:4Fe-4S dicluster domain-containing protein [Haliea sp.]